jgi:hypothetical protein
MEEIHFKVKEGNGGTSSLLELLEPVLVLKSVNVISCGAFAVMARSST